MGRMMFVKFVTFVVFVFVCLSLTACTVGIIRQETRVDATSTPAPLVTPSEAVTSTPLPSVAPSATPTAAPALAPSPVPSRPPAARPITVQYFTAAPEIVNPGESIELMWEATSGQVTLYRLDDLGRLILPAHSVPLRGTLVMTTSTLARNQVSFALFAANAAGTQAQATVSVQVRCPDTWFFSNGPATCPWPAQTGMAALEHFERGVMIWLESPDRIYALYSDGQNPAWEMWSDLFDEGEPESDPTFNPPSGLFQPIRGFGLIWRKYLGTRQRLGWATDQEREIPGVLQCDTAPQQATCYVRGSDDTVYVLYPERSRWSVWGH